MSQLRRMMVSSCITAGLAVRAKEGLPKDLVEEFFRHAGEDGVGELCLTVTDAYKSMVDDTLRLESLRGHPDLAIIGEKIVRTRDGLESIICFLHHPDAPDTVFRKVFREILLDFDEKFKVSLLHCGTAFECFVDLRAEMIQKGVLEYENERLWWTRMADDVQAVLMDVTRQARAAGQAGEACA